ncbi:MAG TPA: 50S ribosomal protein L15 [Acidobacteriota bacterium]|nr:50S ribosomal protein L15 [Acidobacteriota bacterium]
MDIDLSNLKPPAGSRKKPKRVGRGPGSGHGKTSTRGHKGQYARSGSKRRAHKEGGQMPLHRRLPKRGFFNPFRVEYQVVNVAGLAAAAGAETVDVDAMVRMRLVRSRSKPVKILGDGAIDRSVAVSAHAFTRTAREKIEAAGGTCTIVTFATSRPTDHPTPAGSQE